MKPLAILTLLCLLTVGCQDKEENFRHIENPDRSQFFHERYRGYEIQFQKASNSYHLVKWERREGYWSAGVIATGELTYLEQKRDSIIEPQWEEYRVQRDNDEMNRWRTVKP